MLVGGFTVVDNEIRQLGGDAETGKEMAGAECREIKTGRLVCGVLCRLDITSVHASIELVERLPKPLEDFVDGNVATALLPPQFSNSHIVIPEDACATELEHVKDVAAAEFKTNSFGPLNVALVVHSSLPSGDEAPGIPEVANDNTNSDLGTGI
jgi:hypothetical protein